MGGGCEAPKTNSVDNWILEESCHKTYTFQNNGNMISNTGPQSPLNYEKRMKTILMSPACILLDINVKQMLYIWSDDIRLVQL